VRAIALEVGQDLVAAEASEVLGLYRFRQHQELISPRLEVMLKIAAILYSGPEERPTPLIFNPTGETTASTQGAEAITPRFVYIKIVGECFPRRQSDPRGNSIPKCPTFDHRSLLEGEP